VVIFTSDEALELHAANDKERIMTMEVRRRGRDAYR